MGIRPCKREYQNRGRIVQGDGADDHQRSHAGGAVNVLDKGNAKHSGTAAVGGLYKFSYKVLFLVHFRCYNPYQDNGS